MRLFDAFSTSEKRNIAIYIGGIMLYKFALETLIGCMSPIVQRRLSPEHNPARTWGITLSLNYVTQCLGSLAVGPLIKRYNTNRVLATSIFCFGMIVAIVPILEATHGGRGFGKTYQRATWSPFIAVGLFPLMGVFHGVIELIRRVIPRDIVGSDSTKLKKMDSTVHICYEIAGTAGALLSEPFIGYFSFGYSLIIIPILFTLASFVWSRVHLEREQIRSCASASIKSKHTMSLGKRIGAFFTEIVPALKEFGALLFAFFHSVRVGAQLVMTRRSLIWLTLAYILPLVLHRYLETVLFSHYANYVLNKPEAQQVLVGGSNFGELLGALFVLLFSNAVKTPLPWLRLDAITLYIGWIFSYATPFADVEKWTWTLAAVMVFVSFGWAAGDVSLLAYIQSHLDEVESTDSSTSLLGSVMAFLYVGYIAIFAVLSPVMGFLLDSYTKPILGNYELENAPLELRPLISSAARQALVWEAGVFMSICAVIILAATFIPKGSFVLNPDLIEDSRSSTTLPSIASLPPSKIPMEKGSLETVVLN